MYSISHPNKYGEPTIDLSADNKAVICDEEKLTDLQLKHHRVMKRLFAEYGITAPITKNLCDILRCKLWRMGQRLSNAGGKKNKILESWKSGDGADWELSIDCVKVNKELNAQISSNEAKLNQLIQENNELQTQLEGTKQKLKEIQNVQSQMVKSNKRMASALTNPGSKAKRKRQEISKLSRQQKWS